MKAKLFTAAKLAITILFFTYIFREIDFRQFAAALAGARIDYLLGGFVLLWVAHFICIYRWRLLMRPLMPVPPLGNLLGIYCIGLFFNLTFPTVIGGDVVKVYYAGRPSRCYARSLAAAFLDRDAGMLAMMIIACAAVTVYPVSVPGIPVTLILWSVFALFVLGNAAVFTPGMHRILIRLLRHLHLDAVATRIDLVSRAFQVMGRRPGMLWGSLAISFINQLLVISVTWIMALGLGIRLPFLLFLVFVPVITLISMIPISLNGMGLREYSFMSLFGAVGVPAASCIALGVLSSVVIILSSLPGGIVYLLYRNKTDLEQMASLESEFS
jgi:uncharacterized protein (TIRG00374 family)